MGMSKAWLPMGSETILQRLAHMLTQSLSQVVVVASRGQRLPPLDENVRIAHDRSPDLGPLEGLAVGLSSLDARDECAMVVACDMPLLQPLFVKCLVSSLEPHEAVVPFVAGRPHPLVAVYRTSVLAKVEHQLSSARLSMREFLAEIDVHYLDQEQLSKVDPQLQSLRNINRPEDYREIAREFGFEVPAELRDQKE